MLHDTSFWKKLNDHLLRHCRDRSTSLRHRSVDNLHHGQELHDLLHCAPLNPLLRPRLHESRGPTSSGKHLVIFISEVLCACRLGRRSGLSRSGPGLPWRAVVCTLGQGHCDAQTLMTQELSAPSQPPPTGGTQHAVDIHDVHSLHLKTEERHKQGHFCGETAWVVVVVDLRVLLLVLLLVLFVVLVVVVLLVLVLVVVVMVLT